MSKTIGIAVSILVVLVLVWLLFSPSKYTPSRKDLSPGFERFSQANFDDVAKIVLAKGKGKVELKKDGDRWVVASSYGYPADKEQVEKIVKSLREIKSGEEAGKSESSHEVFEVDKEKGGFVTLYGKDDKELAKLVVGKYATGGGFSSTRVYTRFDDEVATFNVETDLGSQVRLYGKDAEGKNYLLKDVVKIPEDMEVQSVRLIRPDKPDVLLERKFREVPVEEKKEEAAATPEEEKKPEEAEKKEEKKPATKKEPYFVVTSGTDVKEIGKSEEYQAKSLLEYKKTVTVEDAVEPKPLGEYGLDKPQLKAVVTYRKKDQDDAELKTVTLLFGNAVKDEKGETKSYYLTLEGDEFKDRIYTIQSWTYDGWNKEMKDFLPKPKEEEKPKEAAKPKETAPASTEAPKPGTEAPGGVPAPTTPAPVPTTPAPVPTTPAPGQAAPSTPEAVAPPAATPPAGAPPAPAAEAPKAETPPPAPPVAPKAEQPAPAPPAPPPEASKPQ